MEKPKILTSHYLGNSLQYYVEQLQERQQEN